jgi:hypothetical protein
VRTCGGLLVLSILDFAMCDENWGAKAGYEMDEIKDRKSGIGEIEAECQLLGKIRRSGRRGLKQEPS